MDTLAGTRIESLSVPLETGLDLIAGAFGILARSPGIDRMFAQRFGSQDAIENMRRFVASYDQYQESLKKQGSE